MNEREYYTGIREFSRKLKSEMAKKEKVRLRDVVNPCILNDAKYVGFQGDSEFVDRDGKLQLGSWTYKENLGNPYKSYPDQTDKTLDSLVYVDLLFGGYNPFTIANDNDELCIVEINYAHCQDDCEMCSHYNKCGRYDREEL